MKKQKYYTYQLDMVYLNVLAIIIFVVVWLFVFMFGEKEYLFSDDSVGYLIIFMILWLMLHEVIHGIGFGIFKSVKKKNICFGMALEKGVFYCMCKQKISKKVILTSLLFPFTFIGVITLIIGMFIHSYYLVMLSILNISGAVGDLVMTVYFLRAPNDIVYLDLDDPTSFTVLSHSDLTNMNVKGVKLIESGIYNDKMEAHDKRRIVISRASCVILIIMIVIAIMMLFIRR